MKLQTKIFLGLVIGVVVGAIAQLPGAELLQRVVLAIEPFGTVFIRLITMTVVPLVVASLFVGVASLGDVRKLGRIGGKTLAFSFGMVLIAATVGLVVALVMQLGEHLDPAVQQSVLKQFESQGANVVQQAARAPSLVQQLVDMVPSNPFAAAAQGDLLQLIVVVSLFGAAATMLKSESQRAVVTFFEGLNDLSMVVIRGLMKLTPPAVFVLIAAAVARSGLDLLASLLVYCLVCVLAQVVHVATTQMLALRFGARLGVIPFFRSVSDALMVAFSTASSSVTLPVSIAAAKNRLGISNQIVSFVLPTGVLLNKQGSAVYKAVTAVFIARMYGLELGPAQYVTIILATFVAASVGAGVPGSSLVTTLIVLNALGLGPRSAAGIALVVAVDRPLDMVRSTVNAIGNLVVTAWIARTEGEKLEVRPDAALAPEGAGAA